MRISFRVAALAAAAFSFVSIAGFAPSLATEAADTEAVPYTAHAESTLSVDSLGLNDLQDPAPAAVPAIADGSAVHAAAPVLPEPEARPERDGRSLAALVDDYASAEAPDEETDCLARAVYYESKGEPLAGQLSVAEVILNRAESGRFRPTICGVVRQPGQFSFVRGGHIPTPPASSRDWRVAVAIARIATEDLADGGAPRALFFHARRVNPGWRHTRVATIGNHVFYR